MRADTTVGQDRLSIERIQHHCVVYTVGRRIHLYESVASTNETLRDLARAGAPEGTVVLAEHQTAGRGRAGKVWFSPMGVNLYASVLFWPRIAATSAAPFSFMASLALTDAIRELGLSPANKWPNDVLLQGRKVAGTLAEESAEDDRLEYVILGVGVNVNVERETLRDGLGEAAQSATSLREALGHPVDRNAFTAAFLGYLDEWLIRYRGEGDAALLRARRDRDIVTGRRLDVRDGSRIITGRAQGYRRPGTARGRGFPGPDPPRRRRRRPTAGIVVANERRGAQRARGSLEGLVLAERPGGPGPCQTPAGREEAR